MRHESERAIALEGTSNFRDLGGYPGHGGRHVRWRRVFRSAHLGAVSARDVTVLGALGVERVLDFRGVDERAGTARTLPGAALHGLPIEPSVAARLQGRRAAGGRVDAAEARAAMADLYRGLVTDHAGRYAEFFAHLLQARGPVVFHCTAGKDRTGVAAALFLLALGVPRPLVEADYLLSNRLYVRPSPEAPQDPELAEALAVVWQVQSGFLDAALGAIDREHGGIEPFLVRRLGLGAAGLEALATRYLDDGGGVSSAA